MPTEPLLIDAGDPDLKSKVDALTPVPGYCIFIDIVGSAAMKQRNIREWIALIHNGFASASTFLFAFRPLKGIGDELMYYIEESDLLASVYSPLQVFDGLYQIANELDASFPATKIIVAYCSSVYAMTFIPFSRDYYGIDIDRAARLKGSDIKPRLREREVIIDAEMYRRVKDCYDRAENQSQYGSVLDLYGPTSHTAKGIPDAIAIYRTTKF